MYWRWKDFSLSNQQLIEAEIREDFSGRADIMTMASCIHGLLSLDYHLNNCQQMKNCVFQGFSSRQFLPEDHRSLANIVYYLGKFGIKWIELPNETKQSFYQGIEQCCSSFSEQEISNTIYG
jgi:hypothetical protein